MMLGLNGQNGSMTSSTRDRTAVPGGSAGLKKSEPAYRAYFGLGHSIQLIDRPGVFRLSSAGLSLGALLVRHLERDDLRGHFLELGTGSGVLALVLRSIGARSITATDVSAAAVRLAKENELLNFGDTRIDYAIGHLFTPFDDGTKFDYVIFNPPGWRTPSERLTSHLSSAKGDHPLELPTMFCGESVVLEFLKGLPGYLVPSGRAIIGLNSMIGIQDILSKYTKSFADDPPLRFKLLERHCFPLFFYTDSWSSVQAEMLEEFHRWKDQYNAIFGQGDDGTIYWSYEIVECTLGR